MPPVYGGVIILILIVHASSKPPTFYGAALVEIWGLIPVAKK